MVAETDTQGQGRLWFLPNTLRQIPFHTGTKHLGQTFINEITILPYPHFPLWPRPYNNIFSRRFDHKFEYYI